MDETIGVGSPHEEQSDQDLHLLIQELRKERGILRLVLSILPSECHRLPLCPIQIKGVGGTRGIRNLALAVEVHPLAMGLVVIDTDGIGELLMEEIPEEFVAAITANLIGEEELLRRQLMKDLDTMIGHMTMALMEGLESNKVRDGQDSIDHFQVEMDMENEVLNAWLILNTGHIVIQ